MADENDASYCNNCGRKPVPCRYREMTPAQPYLGINEPWEFRYYICRWCQAAETRRHRKIFGDQPNAKESS